MSKLRTLTVVASTFSLAASTLLAQATANEHNCPSSRGGAEAIPPFVGPGSAPFSPNQSLCLPRLAPVPTKLSPLAFIVQGVEPGDRVDPQGTVYVVSIRGVPGGVDLWRWNRTLDGSPNTNQTLPFKYEGQPDNCGIFSLTNGGCANNVGTPENLGLAPGGGDADIAVNGPDQTTGVPNLPLTSLALVPGVTGTHSTDRGDNFTPPNPLAAAIGGDDRQWNDAIDSKTVYLAYHDIATFNIDAQRSNDGGLTYVNGFGEAIDPQTFPTAGTLAGTANLAAQIQIDHSSCSSRGNLYQLFVAPNDATENVGGQPMRSAYVGVSIDAKRGRPAFMFTDYKVYTGPVGANNANIFPALAVDRFGFLYGVWSDNKNIFFTSSSDHGKTWTTARTINQGATVGKANVFPWVAADANGHVVVAWLGADITGNSNLRSVMEPGHTETQNGACDASFPNNDCMRQWAKWNVYVLETVNGHAAVPTFTQFTASDHVIHRGSISTGGLGGSPDRKLADFFQVALDPQHRANISFADDHIVSPLSQGRTGTDNPDDPRSFRVGVPYFTYRLQPPTGGVTVGSCAGVQGEQEVEDEGEGEDEHHDEMSFVDKQQPEENGTLVYHDPGQSLDVTSSNGVRSIGYSGSCVSFIGDAKVNGQLGYQFTFGACDFSATGGTGSFSISLSGPAGYSYQRNGTLTTGFVKLHQVVQP